MIVLAEANAVTGAFAAYYLCRTSPARVDAAAAADCYVPPAVTTWTSADEPAAAATAIASLRTPAA